MAKQTFISCYYKGENDSEHLHIDFDRWSYKKPETILEKVLDFIRKYPSLAKEWNYIRIYATPDGYKTERLPTLVYDVRADKKATVTI